MPDLSGRRGAHALSGEATAFLRWLSDERHRAPNTVAGYRADLVAYEAHLDALGSGVTEADDAAVARYIACLGAAGRKPASVARAAVAIRALHRFLGRDVGASVSSPPVPPPDPAVLSAHDVGRLLGSVAGDGAVERRDRAMLQVLYASGMRISELVALDVADFPLPGHIVTVARGTLRQREVPLHDEAAAATAAWLDVRGLGALGSMHTMDPLFVNARGGRLSRQGAWGIVRRRGEAVGLGERLTPQVLRHSCAAHLLDSGLPTRAVQERLGQSLVRPARG